MEGETIVKREKVATMLLCGLLAFSMLSPSSAAHAAKTAPVPVASDLDDDWGEDLDPALAPVGDALGQELIGATIGMNGRDKIDFVIQLKSLPSAGGAPEVSRYMWNMKVDRESLELDGKYTNYSRGICDPTSGQCPPPRDPGEQPFFVRGDCKTVETEGGKVRTCKELGVVKGIFDPSEGTITVTVPRKLLGAGEGSRIGPGRNTFGGSISAAPAAFVTNSIFPLDTMTVTKTFVVPDA